MGENFHGAKASAPEVKAVILLPCSNNDQLTKVTLDEIPVLLNRLVRS